MPTRALPAAHDSTTVANVSPRDPLAKRYTIGTIRNSTSCLESMKLARGSIEKAADTSVIAAYAINGQKKRGASNRSCRTRSSPSQHATAIVSRIWAAAMENWSAPATQASAIKPASSRRDPLSGWGVMTSAPDSAVIACSMDRTILSRGLDEVRYPRKVMKLLRNAVAIVVVSLTLSHVAGPDARVTVPVAT